MNNNQHLFQSWVSVNINAESQEAAKSNPLIEGGLQCSFQTRYKDLERVTVTNAFSINMLSETSNLKFIQLDESEAKWVVSNFGHDSAVGHADTAAVLSSVLGIEVPMNRTTLQMQRGTALLVGQYKGPRLAEGTMELPEGASIEWWLVRH